MTELTIGEGVRYFEGEEAKKIESILNSENALRRKSYYLFKFTNWTSQFGNEMRTTYQMRSTKPPVPILGSKLWLIDNDRGAITKVWDLARDVKDADKFSSGEQVKENFDSAQQFGGAVVHA